MEALTVDLVHALPARARNRAPACAAQRLVCSPGGDRYLAASLVCGRWEVLAAAMAAASTAGTKSIPIDSTPASAASARQAAPKIKPAWAIGGWQRRPATQHLQPAPQDTTTRASCPAR